MFRLGKSPIRYLTYLLLLTAQGINAESYSLRGSLGIHDPSRVIKCNNRFYVFGTGQGIISKWSADGKFWQNGPSVFTSPPAWTTNTVPGVTGIFWAPDIIQISNSYFLYYSVSTWGSQVSAIGVASNQTLDLSSPLYKWVDLGPVIVSTNGSPYNCIDPAVEFDGEGRLWLAFGSFWNGIYIVQLDPTTGLRISNNSPVYHLAYSSAIEAPFIYRRGPYYYLFVNWGACCRGIDSTYQIRVGRATSITGPYRDKNGIDMRSGGGSPFLQTTGKFIGPGHIGIFSDGTNEWFSYHFYDADAGGRATLDIRRLSWDEFGWPVFTNDWIATYLFDDFARDLHGQYSGILVNDPPIQPNPEKGSVLRLSGTNQFVSLPNGVGNACTIITVFRWHGTNTWERVFDFGRGTSKYAFLTPKASSGKLRFAITTNGIGGERTLETPGPIPTNKWIQVAVVLSGSNAILYTNGALVATTQIPFSLADIVPTNVWIGRSQFPVDPYFNGEIAYLIVSGRPLSESEIKAPKVFVDFPPENIPVTPGKSLYFSGVAYDFLGSRIPESGLTWWIEYHTQNGTNLIWGPASGLSKGTIELPPTLSTNPGNKIVIYLEAIDTSGRRSLTSVPLIPSPNHYWQAFYPFNSGATDVLSGLNGTLYRGATTPNLSYRGNVLMLSASRQQYVSLPNTMGQMQTFSAWIYTAGPATWERIFDFGSNTSAYVYATTRAISGNPRIAISINGPAEEYAVESPSPLPTNKWTHIATVFTGRECLLYIDGRITAVNNATYLLPSDVMAHRNYLGRSQFTTDPFFNGLIDSVFICSYPVSSSLLPISRLDYVKIGQSIHLCWEACELFSLLNTSSTVDNTSWREIQPSFATNGMYVAIVTPTNSAEFFKLKLRQEVLR